MRSSGMYAIQVLMLKHTWKGRLISQSQNFQHKALLKGQPIYILCGGGSKAPRAAELLEGFDSAREYVILMGGTRAARDAGLALEQSN